MSIHLVRGYLHSDPYRHLDCVECGREIQIRKRRLMWSYIPALFLLLVPFNTLKWLVLPALWVLLAQDRFFAVVDSERETLMDGQYVCHEPPKEASGRALDDESL